MRDGWERTTLGEIADVVGGGTPKTSVPEYWGGDILWVTPSEVAANEGAVITATERTLTQAGLDRSSAKLLPAGAVLLTTRATIGATAIAGVPMATNQGFQSLVPGPRVLPEFLMYWCQTHKADFVARAGGNTFLEISRTNVRSLPIELPPLDEQKRIVDLVDAFDAASEATAALEAAADVAAEALFADFLAHPEPTWEHVTLADVADVTMGRQRSPKHQAGDHPVAYLRAANVKDGRLVLDDVLKMNFALAEQRKYSLRPGDVLVTEGCGSLKQLGASASWNGELEGTVCFQNTLLRLRAKEGRATPDFVRLWARHAHHAGIWARIASGTNIFHIGATRASQLPLVVPPLDQQAQITNLVQATYGLSSAASTVARTRATARSELVRALLSGRHAIPDSYDELLAEEV